MAERLQNLVPKQAGEPSGSRNDDYFSRKAVSSSGAVSQTRHLASNSPTSPRTPLLGRSISSSFNSPGQIFRVDDEFFVFEFGSRYLRAGLGGEGQPRCRLSFGPETQKRAGDLDHWLHGSKSSTTLLKPTIDSWDLDHVLWQMDLRKIDLGLVKDKLDRALRCAIVDHLLVLDDSKKRKFVLAVPSDMPHPLLSTMLSSLFNVFTPPPSVLLFSSAVLSTIAAGLRSGLVVDIGWAGTTATAIYEYREVQSKVSYRAMKLLSWEVRNLILSKLADQGHLDSIQPSFNDIEQVLFRMIWCRKRDESDSQTGSSTFDRTIDIPLESSHPSTKVSIPFYELAQPVDRTFFPSEANEQAKYDDEELPLPLLVFYSLLALPIDVRQVCLSRIIITGGGSNIPGLKARLLHELSQYVSTRGWDPVENYGSAKNPKTRRIPIHANGFTTINEKTIFETTMNGHSNKDINPESESATHQQPPLPDPVLASLQNNSSSGQRGETGKASATASTTSRKQTEQAHPSDRIQGVQSLGAWAGASLIAGLRVRGQVEIDRERFMQYGLAAANQLPASKRQSILHPATQRQSLAGGSLASTTAARPGDRDSANWTLGIWA